MPLGKVLARGQITLPKEVRLAAGIEPGDKVIVRAKKPGTIEIEALPRLTLAQTLEMYHIEGPIDWDKDREAWEAEAAKHVISEQ